MQTGLDNYFPATLHQHTASEQWIGRQAESLAFPNTEHSIVKAILARERCRVACKGCNSGWMSGLDDWAKPILAPLIGGKPFVLTPHNRKILATWAAKTASTAEHGDAC